MRHGGCAAHSTPCGQGHLVTSRLRHALDGYARDVSRLSAAESTTEATYYPAIKSLIEAALSQLELRLDVRASTSEARRSGGRDAPDFAIYDGAGGFVMLYVEVKLVDIDVRELAVSRDNNDQIGRYLSATSAVLLCTLREFAVVTSGGTARRGVSVAPANRRVSDVIELWPTVGGFRSGSRIADERGQELTSLLEDVLTRHTPVASPETLARVLARQARRASASLPAQFSTAVGALREDFASALGISFDGSDGEHFFRSSLIQTVYYGIFAGWLLHSSEWHAIPAEAYDWRRTGDYLRIPFLADLFHEFLMPGRMRELGLREHLETAAATLDRVHKEEFFRRLEPTTASGGGESFSSAIVYFYEPFLAAFDPALRDELGVWYTPPDIVRYQVRRVDQLLRNELGCPRGLADENVVVMDPACGTGAYLIETLRCIADTLREEGVGAELAATLRSALEHRIRGFEILTAPFVVAHLQLYLLLAELGAAPDETHRAGVFLTNALTGWNEAQQTTLHFAGLQEEHDAAQRVKREERIVVVIGNPPYNRFVGAPMNEEQSLVDPYKGIRRDSRGRQAGLSDLWTRWGVRKQLLDDLYIRFFRLAEEQIGIKAEFGIVSFISNSSFLTGRSHPIMRESLLSRFDAVWIDNLNGDKYKTGKIIPDGMPGAGSVDASVFVVDNKGGIQVGTCISTWLKSTRHRDDPALTQIFTRDFWGAAERKRRALVESLQLDSWSEEEVALSAARPEGPRVYTRFRGEVAHRWKLCSYEGSGNYEDWPSVDELFGSRSPGVNPNRGLDGSVVDTDRRRLRDRMLAYFSAASDDDVRGQYPALFTPRARYEPGRVRGALQAEGFNAEKLADYQLFPLDARTIYYEPSHKFLNEGRDELYSVRLGNEFLVLVNESRRTSETKPLLSRAVYDLHLFDVGAQAFFAERRERIERALDSGQPEFNRVANLSIPVWTNLSRHWDLAGDLRGAEARWLVRALFRVTLAVGHAPEFQREFIGSLAHDWIHIPIPRDRELLERLVSLGDQVAILLDPFAESDSLRLTLDAILGADAARLAVLSTEDGGAATEEDLLLKIAHFGAAPGGWRPRSPATAEPWRDAWGERTGDLSLNDRVFLRHVPERVWRHELGGYQVIKKWLGYREARRRNDEPLTLSEIAHLRSMVQRIAALLVLEAQLDAAYGDASANAFTAEELGV